MFLNNFLIPEMKKIADNMGFKSCPTPKFEDIDLRDEAEWERIVTQLTSLGILTPTEGLEALDTGRLPTAEESLEHQPEYRQQRDKGFYEPLVGGPFDQLKIAKLQTDTQVKMSQNKTANPTSPGGRPNNVNTKQTTQKIGISRGSVEEAVALGEAYSLSKIKENLILASELRTKVKEYISTKKKNKKFNDEELKIIDGISEVIIANSKPDSWIKNIEKYVHNPVNDNDERIKQIDNIAIQHGLDPKFAVYLIDSIK